MGEYFMQKGTYNDFKNYLVEKKRKSPFYTRIYKYILETYKSPIIDTFNIYDIEIKLIGDNIDSSEYYYTDNESVKRNLQNCIEQVIQDLCNEGRIKRVVIKGSDIPSYAPNYPEFENNDRIHGQEEQK